MKKLLPRLLALLLVITMLPISAFASLENHNVSDVTIVQSDTEDNYYFPDIIKLPDGRLIACYYQAAMHVGSNSYGVIYLAESTDNGYNWSDPWKVVDRTAESKDSRDPNLAVLPNGTIVLTYFGNGTFMMFSEDGGRTWSDTVTIESDILDISIAKRGTIAVINDENMLVPCYGVSSGINAYGAPATASGKGQFSSYHRDAVMLHYQLVDGEWTLVYESLIGQEIDETALLYNGDGSVDGSTYDGEVWAFSREDGTVRVTKDCGRTWQVMAKEEPRQWTTSGTIMSAEQIIQPRFVQISDDCWFATYASYTVFNYAYDKQVRPVYGKVFFPEAGWYATNSKLIYDEQTFGVSDMADPATVLTAEGRLLTIYYNTGTKSISGTFSDLEDWVDVDADSLGTETVEREFWSGAFSSLETAQSMFNVNTKHWSWTDAGTLVEGPGSSMTSLETISGDYSVQFNFKFSGTSTDASGDDRDEGFYVLPLKNSTNPNRTGSNQYRVKYSPYQGVQLTYNESNNSDYSGVLAGARASGTNYGEALPSSLEWGKTYTTKIAKMGDGLYVKIWEAGTVEPSGWQCEYHDSSIDVADSDYEWNFEAYLVNKPWTYNPADTESVLLSEMEFNQITYTEWDVSNNFSASTVKFNNGSASEVAFDDDGNGWTVTNGYMTWFQTLEKLGGDFDLSMDVTFHKDFDYDQSAPYYRDNGLTVQPMYEDGVDRHRIIMSLDRGLQVYNGVTGSSYGGYGTLISGTNAPSSFALSTAYTLKVNKVGSVMKIKAWETGTTEPDWQFEIDDPNRNDRDSFFFDVRWTDKQYDGSKSYTVDNVSLSGQKKLFTPFWENALSEPETVMHFSNAGPGWTWPDGGLTTPDSWTTIVSKDTISGDYTAQLDFSLGGVSTDGTTSDRDEGLYILIMEPNSDPTVAGVKQFRIRMSSSEGVQLTYHTNRQGDFGGVCAGKLLSSKGNAASDYVESTLPQSLERNTTYTIKYAKQGDTLSIKIWEAGTTEPAEWQCVYTNSDLDQEEPFDFALLFLNSGTDTENVLVSNAAFSQLVEVTAVNEIGFKEDAKWTFATMDEALTFSGSHSRNGASVALNDYGSITSSDKISGNYNASFTFTADGESWGEEGLWLEPVYESTNPQAGKHQIQLTSDYGIRVFYKGGRTTNSLMELTDDVVVNNFYYEAGETYNVKVSKAYNTLAVKIWNADEAEPLGWNVYWQQDSIGSMVYYKTGSYSYPYDFSRYGDLDENGNPYQWRFALYYRSSDGTGITVSDVELSKQVVMELNLTELTINEGEKPLNVELNTNFYPNIFAQLPTPEGSVEYSTTTGNAETTAIIHPAGVRIQRANVTGVAAGEDIIVASYPGITDSEGNVVEVTCAVTVNPANPSDEFKSLSDGYISEILYAEDFEEQEVFENAVVNETTQTYTVTDTNYNALSEFFDYAPFYAMGHMSVLETEEGDNRYLKTYSGSGSGYAGVQLQSKEKLTGDYTFQADVYLPNGSAEFRLNLSDHKGWSKPSGEGTYVRTFGANMTSLEKMEYADYQFGFRQWMTRGRLNSAAGIYLYDETAAASGWQTVKAVKAGNTVYFKSWAKGTPEPDWEVIFVDDKITAADEAYGGFYLTIDFDANYTDKDKYSASGEILMDNIRITRQVPKGDAVISDVTLDLGGGTLAEGKDITEYAEGTIVDLPTAEEISREGYIFEGWYDNAEFEGDPITAITADMTGDLTIYAKWVEDENYIDTDNLGPATGGMDSEGYAGLPFTDVRTGDWFYEAVEYVVINGLMTGISDTQFAPGSTLNRAMVVTVLWRMEGEPVVNYLMQFEDVPADQWYTEAVRWAASEGIVNGMDAKTYAPLNPVTREQLVTILWRYAQKKGYDVSVGEDTNILSYTDAFSISEYAIPAMQWACGAGVINGNDDGSLNPKGNTKRSEFAKVIMNFCENVAD